MVYNQRTGLMDRALTMALERDGKEITLFTSGAKYNVFFRKYSDNKSETSIMVCYYTTDIPISPGTTFKLGNDYYIAVNQETGENDEYYKSAVYKCNCRITTATRSVIGLPGYIDPIVNSNKTKSSEKMSFLDGNAEIVVEADSPLTQALNVNDECVIFGRAWEITNIFQDIDGVTHLVVEVREDLSPDKQYTFDNDDYKIIFTGLVDYHYAPGDSVELKAKVYNNGTVLKYALLTYSTSNENVATVDNAGKVTFVADGSVTVTAISTNIDGLSKTSSAITVKTADTGGTVEIFIENETTLYEGIETDFSCYVARGGKVVTDIPISYRIESTQIDIALVKVTPGTGKVTLQTLFKKGSHLDGKKFNLIAYNTANNVSKSQTITIASAAF